ncbi:MAG: PIN domain-containing protein [Acidimicrobiia bacterium]|nr:PIN domain-containing protein [Acidimicrobiia bacterium]
MKLVDANVLLYAVNRDAEHHETSRAWLDGVLSGDATVAFAWVALLAFVRLSTKAGLFPSPLSVDGALDRVQAWTTAGPAVIVEPAPDHAMVLRRLLGGVGVGGNLVNDAHLAALAVEHRCTVVSYDNDFSRFEGITWEQPMARR